MPIFLRIFDISVITRLKIRGLAEKSKRQQWPYFTESHTHGSPIHIYPLGTLPDEVQIAWAKWDEDRRNAGLAGENSVKAGKSEKRLLPVSREQAIQALAMPIRNNWVKTFASGSKPRKGGRVYDGNSTGLCPEARQILLRRFPELAEAKPDSSDRGMESPPSVQETSGGYRGHSPKKAEGISTTGSNGEIGRQIRQLKEEVIVLKAVLKDCQEDKKNLKESLQFERKTFESALSEKDRTIEALKQQFSGKQPPKKTDN